MPEGVIIGGWGYVAAAYGLTLVGLVAYLISLVKRLHHLDRDGKDG